MWVLVLKWGSVACYLLSSKEWMRGFPVCIGSRENPSWFGLLEYSLISVASCTSWFWHLDFLSSMLVLLSRMQQPRSVLCPTTANISDWYSHIWHQLRRLILPKQIIEASYPFPEGKNAASFLQDHNTLAYMRQQCITLTPVSTWTNLIIHQIPPPRDKLHT